MRTHGRRNCGEAQAPRKPVEHLGALCDTGFLIRLNSPDDPLHKNARGYLKFLLDGGHTTFVSTIALAEYAVRDSIGNLPMKHFRVLPFSIDHAQKAGEFASIVFSRRDQLPTDLTQRTIIPNDTKLFAQADVTQTVTHYLTADLKCAKVCKIIQDATTTQFQILQLTTSHYQAFGLLDLEPE